MKKWNWKNLLPPPMLVALLFASCNLIQEMPQDFVETYGNIAYVEKVDYVGLAEDVENGKPAKVTQTKNFKIIYSIRNDGNFDLSPEFTFEGCQIKNPHVDTEKKRVSLTVPGEELKALADGADFKVKLTLYKASQKVLQSSYELGMRYVRTDEPETPKFPVEIPIPGLKLPDGYTLSVKDSTEFKAEKDENGSWIITTIGSGVSEDKYTLELVVKDKDGNPLKDENGNEITIDKTIEVSAGGTTSGFTEKDDEKSFDEFIKEVEEKIKENETNPPEESKNPPTEPETPKGKVEIKVEVPEGYTIVDIEDKDKFKVEKDEDGSYKIVTKEEGGLPEGEYELELVVKDEKTGEEVTIKKEVEVSAGETTGGFTGEPDDKPSEITQDEIEKEKKNVVYVRGSDASWYENNYPDATASDTNSGALLEPFATIQKAIDTVIERNKQDEAANPNSYTIYIDGTLTQDATPGVGAKGMADFSDLKENLNLTIKSLSETEAAKATLNADKNSRVMYVKPNSGELDLTLENLIITGGNARVDAAGNGGGIYFDGSDGTLKMEGCTVKGSEATNGGGVYLNSGTLTIENCEISGNKSTTGGAIFVSGSTATISETTISGNNATQNGGGVYVTGGTSKLTITGGEISGGNTANSGGGVYINGGTFEMTGGEINGNEATSEGGGIYVSGSKPATISGTKIYDNKARVDGGGIYVIGAALTMNGTITNNTAQQGGGVYVRDNTGVFTMTGGEISDNHTTGEVTSETGKDSIAGGGIFIYNGAKADISDTTISNNTSNNNGGGIHINGGTLKIKAGTIISGNVAENYGGGVYVNDIFEMDGGTISGNTAKQDGGGVYVTGNNGVFTMSYGTINGGNNAKFGGGVYIGDNGKFIMNYGEISGNKADGDTDSGGGGVNVNSGTFEMKGGTISGNEATGSNFGGGGVYVNPNQKFTMSDTAKISGNKATKDGGGVYSNNGIFEMEGDSTISTNTAQYGGGVYLMAGANTFTMSGGEISGNTANEQGGGVYVNSTTFSMSGTAKVNGNIATDSGGGIYVYKDSASTTDAVFTMDGGEISENTANGTYNGSRGGGGICNQGGKSTIHSGKISKNKATYGKGGGVCHKSGTFTMNGGTIGGDSADDKNTAKDGGGVYVESGTFEMSGYANFDENNDVHLYATTKITITGELYKDYVATITPFNYSDGITKVLSAGTDVTIDQTVCDKFKVTPQTNGTKWKVVPNGSTAGVLKKDNVDVGGSGGISVTIPGVGSYTFVVKVNDTDIVNENDDLPSGRSVMFEVFEGTDSNGKKLTTDDGVFTIKIQDRGGYELISASEARVTVPSYPFELEAQIYVKVELTSRIVIDKTIPVKIVP